MHVSAEDKDSSWVLSVSDNGIGIAPEDTDSIFEIFKRLHISSEYSVTGIGLAICKKIVERHGGRIWAVSELDKQGEQVIIYPDEAVRDGVRVRLRNNSRAETWQQFSKMVWPSEIL